MRLEIDEDGKIFWDGWEWCRLYYTDKANARSYLERLQDFMGELDLQKLKHDLDEAIEMVDAISEAENWDAVSDEVVLAVKALKVVENTIIRLNDLKEEAER